jgi:hypothetical protein
VTSLLQRSFVHTSLRIFAISLLRSLAPPCLQSLNRLFLPSSLLEPKQFRSFPYSFIHSPECSFAPKRLRSFAPLPFLLYDPSHLYASPHLALFPPLLRAPLGPSPSGLTLTWWGGLIHQRVEAKQSTNFPNLDTSTRAHLRRGASICCINAPGSSVSHWDGSLYQLMRMYSFWRHPPCPCLPSTQNQIPESF